MYKFHRLVSNYIIYIYEKACYPILRLELEIQCFVKAQMLKLDHNFHGSLRVCKVTGTNAEIKAVTNPDV